MAKLDNMVPFILHWEVGYNGKATDPQTAYTAAARKGYHCIAGDKGGPTMCGVTLATYKTYCRQKGLPVPTVATLKALPFKHWYDITKSGFWDKCHADLIVTDSHAWVLVDWMFTAGVNAIKNAQRALGVTADGIVGNKTLAAINGGDPRTVFNTLQAARTAYYRRIATGTNAKFLRGWLNRTNAITFTRLNY